MGELLRSLEYIQDQTSIDHFGWIGEGGCEPIGEDSRLRCKEAAV